MHHWLNDDPVVRETWTHNRGMTLEQIAAKYDPRIRGEEPSDPYVILCDGTPIGYIQCYLWRNYPDYAQHLDLKEEAASLDVFVGEASYRGRGLGPAMLQTFLRDVVFANPQVQSCVITPEVGNTPAIRAYEKVGFRLYRVMENLPEEEVPIYLMRIGREDV